MNGEFKVEYESIDVELMTDGQVSVENWQPEDPLNVIISLDIYVTRTVGNTSSPPRQFSSGIYTKQALDSLRHETNRKVETQNCIVVYEFEWQKIDQSIRNIIKNCERETIEETFVELKKRFGTADW